MPATSHRGVTRQAVAQAAADLVAADGLEALSVRQVANRLGVWPTTVMHHAGGRRDGLIPLLIEHLAAGISTEPARQLAGTAGRAGSTRSAASRWPIGAWPMSLLRSGATGPQALRLADAILGALRRRRPRPRRRAGRLRRLPHLRARQRRPPDDGHRPGALAGVRDARSTQAEPGSLPRPAARRRAARSVATTRASPAASTSSSTPSPLASRSGALRSARPRGGGGAAPLAARRGAPSRRCRVG